MTVRSTNTLLLPAASYGLIQPRSGDSDGFAPSLHNPMLTLAVVQTLSDAVRGILLLGGGLASDLEGKVTGDDVVLTSALLGSYRFGPALTLGAGIGYDRRTGDLAPLPLVQLNWHIARHLRLSGIFPARLLLAWRALPDLTLGINGGLDGNRYHLGSRELPVDSAELAYSVTSAGPVIIVHLTRTLHLHIESGITLNRRFELFFDDVSQGSGGLENTWYVGARLRFGTSGWRSGDKHDDSETDEH